MNDVDQGLLDKLRQLPPQRLAEVEDFVDFLRSREDDRALARAATHAADPVFDRVWNNDQDAEYDKL